MAKRQKLSFCQLDELPDEVILKIVGFLDLKELLLCGQVCKRLQAISNDESLWRSPSMVMTLVFLNGKFLNMTVGNPIPWGCPEGCSIFFLKTKENLNFSLFGAQSRQNLFEVFYRLRQKKNFEKFCPEKKNIDKILKNYWENVDKIRCFYRSIAIWMNECK